MNSDDLVASLHFVGILGNEMNDADGPYLADEKNNAYDVTRCAPLTVKDYSDISLDCQNNQHAELAVSYVAGGYDSAMTYDAETALTDNHFAADPDMQPNDQGNATAAAVAASDASRCAFASYSASYSAEAFVGLLSWNYWRGSELRVEQRLPRLFL
jgi:hypothetical protein